MKKVKKLDFGVDDPNLKQPDFDLTTNKIASNKIKFLIIGVCVGLAIGSFILITSLNKEYAKIDTYTAKKESQVITDDEQAVLNSMRSRLQQELAAISIGSDVEEQNSLTIYYLDSIESGVDSTNSIEEVSSLIADSSDLSSSDIITDSITSEKESDYESTLVSETTPSTESSVTKGLDEDTVSLIDWKNVTNKETYANDVSTILTGVYGPFIMSVMEDDVILVITDTENKEVNNIITDSYNQIFGKTPTIKTQKN